MAVRRDTWEEEEKIRRAAKRRIKIYLTAAVVTAVLVAAVAILSVLYWNVRSELSEAERKLKLREDALAALEAENGEQGTLIETLESQLEDLLNIEEPEPVITSDQLKEQLTSISELATFKYVYTNAARREASKTWLWGWTMPFSDTSLLVTYDGEIKAGINFSAIEIDVDENSRTITVTLPPSEVLDNTIPQETINVLEVKNNLFNEVTFDDYNEFIAAEKPEMRTKAIGMGLLDYADREAQAAVRAFLSVIPGMDSYTLNVVTK